MRIISTWWLGLLFLFLVVGCGTSGEEFSSLKQTTSGLTGEVADLKAKVGALQDSVTRLNERGNKMEGEYASLSGAVENLTEQTKQKEGQYNSLGEAVSSLQLSYKHLTKMVTDAVSNWTKARSDTETKAPVDSRASTVALQERKTDRNDSQGHRLVKTNAEVCEAIEKYTRQIDSIMRQYPSSVTQSKMDDALADFKGVANQFREHKDTLQILAVADDLKWTAYNASKSRTYLAESRGEIIGWRQLARESRTKLRAFCGQ
jgi:hypothetical protein